MRAQEIMTQPVVTVTEDATLEEVARVMLRHRIGGVPVVDARGRLRGIITESDFAGKEEHFPFSTFRWAEVLGRWLPQEGIEQIYQAARATPAKRIMTTDVVTATENDPVEEVVMRMIEQGVHRIPVVRDGVPVGIVARRDLLRLVPRNLRADWVRSESLCERSVDRQEAQPRDGTSRTGRPSCSG
jgi:CBS domain-containing protein